MSTLFTQHFQVKWSDVDPNMHLRHTAYVDFTDQVRFAYFYKKGISVQEFRALQLGPVIFNVFSSYFKEVYLNETISVDCKLIDLSEDKRKWKIAHHILNEKNQSCCKVEVSGGFLDWNTRKLTTPPPKIILALEQMNTGAEI